MLFRSTLFHFLWQGSAIALLAYLAEQLLRRASAQSKYWLHVFAMLLMVGCLPVSFALLDVPARNHVSKASDPTRMDDALTPVDTDVALLVDQDDQQRDASDAVHAVPLGKMPPDTSVGSAEPGSSAQVVDRVGPANAEVGADVPLARPTQPSTSLLAVVAPYVAVIYVACVLAMLGRLATGVWGGRKLRLATVPVADANLLAKIRRQADRIGLRVIPAIAYCERISVPVVVGIVRPMILLPAALVRTSPGLTALPPGMFSVIGTMPRQRTGTFRRAIAASAAITAASRHRISSLSSGMTSNCPASPRGSRTSTSLTV